MPYAELHALSNFSFQRGASSAAELIVEAARRGYAALAITDECSLAGVVRAHQATLLDDIKSRIKLIIGAEFLCLDGLKLVLLAPHKAAYQQLSALITRARRAAPKGRYRLLREDAAELCPDCFALWIPQDDPNAADACWLRAHFRDAWIAVELHRGADDVSKLVNLQQLARASGLRCVASGDVHYHVRQRRALQDVMTALLHKRPVSECGTRLFANAERHLRPIGRLQALYPEALLAESIAIAERCHFSMTEIRYDYPRELVPKNYTPSSWLRVLTRNGLLRRWPDGAPFKVRRQIVEELRLIAELQYEAFFLTVHDIVGFAMRNGILCQGRGSAANSAVCFALGITAVNPAEQRILFARFLSRERAEPPDIDVDFEHQRREEVIQYVFTKYGHERAAIAATVITYRSRSALRDVGRALGVAPEDIDRLAKSLAWWDDPDQLDERLRALGFDPSQRQLRLWMRLTRELTGFPRHLSQHVGGFVISERPLSEMVPVENAAMPDRSIIQWDKDDLEALGLLKVDVLALGMLTAIRRCFDLIEKLKPEQPHWTLATVPQNDPETYAMIQRAETIGVFQIESRGQMNMLVRLRPKTFYDLAIQVAIVRPGPIQGGMVHPYLQRRLDPKKVEYPPRLEEVLKRTLGIPIFQEQVMEIAVIAAGFEPGEADQMRRSMAAWKQGGDLTKFQQKLKEGMTARGYEPAFAERIYQQILGFGSYGFPESHAISFALLAYVSSWLKWHEPAAFIAALLNSQPMGFYPPSMLVREAQRSGVEVRPVDVMTSAWDCSLEPIAGEKQPAIRLGLRMVNGLNENIANALVAARAQQAFDSLEDLVARAGLGTHARRALADADALVRLSGHRHAARWAAAGAELAPGLLRHASAREAQLELPAPSEGREIVDDYRSTNLTLRRHPLALLRTRLQRAGVVTAVQLRTLPDRSRVKVAGLVMFRQRPGTASGLMFMTLEDETGVVNLVVPAKLIEREREVLIGTALIVAEGELQNVENTVHVFLRHAEDRSDWLGRLPYLSRDFQ
ncbi:MAG: putative polymerase alpha chain [Nevskia sp.]|nr:putative polymerase alpha chain [Nevskia sp.]